MTVQGVVLPMCYLPPVEFFVHLNAFKNNSLIDKHEHFIKQSHRNRAHIYSPDGTLALTVPVVKGAKVHTCVKDVKISYDFNWQRLHWLSLQNCYRRSSYFEYYEDDFARFYHEKFEYLFDYNEQILNLLLKLIKLKAELKYTDSYEPEYPELIDTRPSINPKRNSQLTLKPYFQLFEERHGFIANLSIVDLLFNQGPQAVNYL